jgi:hypothetical protein
MDVGEQYTVHARLSLQGDVSLFSGLREFIDCPTLQSLSSRKDMSDLEAFGSIWLCSFAVRPSQTPRSAHVGVARKGWGGEAGASPSVLGRDLATGRCLS